jgi:hypothetical protein
MRKFTNPSLNSTLQPRVSTPNQINDLNRGGLTSRPIGNLRNLNQLYGNQNQFGSARSISANRTNLPSSTYGRQLGTRKLTSQRPIQTSLAGRNGRVTQPYTGRYGIPQRAESVYTESDSEYTLDGEEEYTDSEYTEDDNMSIFSRRGVRRNSPYTNTYGNEREGFNSPSRYSHKHREMTPNPYRRKNNDLGTYTGQR